MLKKQRKEKLVSRKKQLDEFKTQFNEAREKIANFGKQNQKAIVEKEKLVTKQNEVVEAEISFFWSENVFCF